ncbi:MAG: hypothetical protein H0T53_14770 [Herpetosiphonaceae bacterium]|nr:hypothetical protein [Herpetosiphonaceae bacterium]
MDTSNIPHTPYHVPSVGRLHPNIWGWWLGLTILGGMVGEFFAAIILSRVWDLVDSIDNGFFTQTFPIVRYMILLPYAFLFAGAIGICQWFVYNRIHHTGTPRSSGWFWVSGWMIIVMLEYLFRDDPFDDPWIIQSMVLGLVIGGIGGGIQWFALRHTLKYGFIWFISSGSALMLGFAIFRLFAQDRLSGVDGIHGNSYYIGRLFQWAIYGLITGLTLEWMIRVTNRQRHM